MLHVPNGPVSKNLEITELLPFGYEMLVIATSLKPEEII